MILSPGSHAWSSSLHSTIWRSLVEPLYAGDTYDTRLNGAFCAIDNYPGRGEFRTEICGRVKSQCQEMATTIWRSLVEPLYAGDTYDTRLNGAFCSIDNYPGRGEFRTEICGRVKSQCQEMATTIWRSLVEPLYAGDTYDTRLNGAFCAIDNYPGRGEFRTEICGRVKSQCQEMATTIWRSLVEPLYAGDTYDTRLNGAFCAIDNYPGRGEFRTEICGRVKSQCQEMATDQSISSQLTAMKFTHVTKTFVTDLSVMSNRQLSSKITLFCRSLTRVKKNCFSTLTVGLTP